jgi:hypothetical protein
MRGEVASSEELNASIEELLPNIKTLKSKLSNKTIGKLKNTGGRQHSV